MTVGYFADECVAISDCWSGTMGHRLSKAASRTVRSSRHSSQLDAILRQHPSFEKWVAYTLDFRHSDAFESRGCSGRCCNVANVREIRQHQDVLNRVAVVDAAMWPM